ncbi:MAG: nucleotidyltransferase family protein [Ignavibacteria bacterium]|jgi:CTP:molybdopterin cytidylyltransferase MocA
MNTIKISGLIISAGLSGRMKRFKPLADYKGKTFIGNIIHKLEKVCEDIIIVTGYEADRLKSEVLNESPKLRHKLKFVQNDLYQKGMFTSFQKGIEAARNSDWVLYHFVDQPGLPAKFYSELISQIDNKHNWIQPVNKNRRGHPILLARNLFDIIISALKDSNLRELSKSDNFKKKCWECNYDEILQDIDTEDDYQRL